MRALAISLLLSVALPSLAARAGASPQGLTCGQVLTDSVTLRADLVCAGSGSALIVGAHGITIDLDGHTISGDGTLNSIGIDNTGGFDDVTIANGTIENFDWCVRARDADRLGLENVTAVGSGWVLTGPLAGFGALAIEVEDCAGASFENVSVANAAIGIQCVSAGEVRIESTSAVGCFVGIDLWSRGPLQPPTTGTLESSVTTDCVVGLLASHTDDFLVEACTFRGGTFGVRVGDDSTLPVSNVTISECTFRNNTFGIMALDAPPGLPSQPIVGLDIRGNRVVDNFRGIALVEVHGSSVSDNDITRNGDFGLVLFETCQGNVVSGNTVTLNGRQASGLPGSGVGIGLMPNLFLPPLPGPTGNTIRDNTALRNGVFDLFHSAMSSPNAWRENNYLTSSGADIQ